MLASFCNVFATATFLTNKKSSSNSNWEKSMSQITQNPVQFYAAVLCVLFKRWEKVIWPYDLLTKNIPNTISSAKMWRGEETKVWF